MKWILLSNKLIKKSHTQVYLINQIYMFKF